MSILMTKAKGRARLPLPMGWETVRKLASALPEAEEGTSYGTPAFKVRGKLFVRLHQDGEAVVIGIDKQNRQRRLKADPVTYFITEHYAVHPWMLVRLSTVQHEDLRELLEDAWRRVAPRSLMESLETT